MTNAAAPIPPRTLAQRLADGRLPLAEALTFSMILAETLRRMHDSGRAHGAISPANIVIGASGVELLPALLPSGATPYTAPEVLEGRAPDARSDVFSFGAVVYEMLTGRRAFEGDSPAALSSAILNAKPASSGSLAADRLLAGCLAKDPAARLQRMQKVLLELKLLTVAARRAEAPVRAEQVEAALQAQLRQFEAGTSERLQAQERRLADVERGVAEALATLREQLTAMSGELSTVLGRTSATEAAEAANAVGERVMAHVEMSMESVAGRIAAIETTVGGVAERVGAIEQGLDALRSDSATLHQNMAADFQDFEQKLKAQGSAIESVRTAMAQTDDLVERVVEALELLQSSVIERGQERGGASGPAF